MRTYKATNLRQQIYRVLDQIESTGESVLIERNGHRFVLQLADESLNRLSHLTKPKKKAICGDPEDLVNVSVGEWTELNNL